MCHGMGLTACAVGERIALVWSLSQLLRELDLMCHGMDLTASVVGERIAGLCGVTAAIITTHE